MFPLRGARFSRCSRDLDVLRAQRIMDFFILITQKSMRSEKPITLSAPCCCHFFSSKKDAIICINNVIPATNLSLKLHMHFIHSPTREIQIYFHSCMANSKRKFKLLCHKLLSSLKCIKIRTAFRVFNLVLWFYFVFILKTGLNGLVHCNF